MDGDTRKKGRGRRAFYGVEGMSRKERAELARARSVEGLREEAALLRVRVKHVMEAEPEESARAQKELKSVTKAVEALTKLVSAEHRMSPKVNKDLGENMRAVLNSLGDLILPPEDTTPRPRADEEPERR